MKFKLFPFLLCSFLICVSCIEHTNDNTFPIEEGMVKVTILYPSGADNTFNMDYYAQKHMPMLEELFGDALKHYEIDKGIAGRTPNDTVPYVAIGYLYFDSLEAYQKAFAPNAEKILGDIPNYTNTRPSIQISEIIKK